LEEINKMSSSDFAVNPEIVISKLSSRIADMTLQIALLESLVDALKLQITENEESGKNGLT